MNVTTHENTVSTEDIADNHKNKFHINPYNTTFGAFINTKKHVEALVMFCINTDDRNLNYEYPCDEIKLMFITGKNQLEKDLPLWDYPLIFRDNKNNEVVACDLRKYVKPTSETVVNLSDIVRSKDGFEFVVMNALITCDIANGDYGKFRTIEKTVAGGFAAWISTAVAGALSLTPTEKVYMEIACQHFIYVLLTHGDIAPSDISMIVNKISNAKLSIPLRAKDIAEIVNRLNHNVSTLEDLSDNFKIVVGVNKAVMIDTNSIINIIANNWFGPGGTDTALIAIEHIPTWISMLYAATSNKSYRKSRIATMIDMAKNRLKIQDFVKYIEIYMSERKN